MCLVISLFVHAIMGRPPAAVSFARCYGIVVWVVALEEPRFYSGRLVIREAVAKSVC